MTTATTATGTTTKTVGAESELRAAARRRGLTMKELAALMGVSAGYLSQIANGGRPWTPKMREKVAAVLGEVPGQGTVYRQGGVVTGESSFIRERARTLGMTMKDLADRVGVSYSYMTQVARGRQNMGVKVQVRVESALHAPAKIAPAQCANRPASVVSGESSYIRERARELGMNLRELADRVGVSHSYMSMVARGRQSMGVKVQARVEAALEAPVKVAPAQPACIDPQVSNARNYVPVDREIARNYVPVDREIARNYRPLRQVIDHPVRRIGDHCCILDVRSSNGVQGGVESGDSRSGAALAVRHQPARYINWYGAVARDSAQVHRGGRGGGSGPGRSCSE